MFFRSGILLAALVVGCRTPEHSDTQAALPEALLDAWCSAVMNRDLPSILECYAESEDTVLIHSTGQVVRGSDAIRSEYESAFSTFEFEDVSLDLAMLLKGDGMACATGRLRLLTRQLTDDTKWQIEINTSFVMRSDGERWRIVLEQSTPVAGVPRVRPRQTMEPAGEQTSGPRTRAKRPPPRIP